MLCQIVLRIILSVVFLNISCQAKSGAPGGPGSIVLADAYNQVGAWNRTYSLLEPQQIHLSWINDGHYSRVQFVTMEAPTTAQLKYWPTGSSGNETLIQDSQSWAFVDGGLANRTTYYHSLNFEPLTPDSVYEYQVGTISEDNTTSEQWSEIYTVKAPSAKSDFSFLVAADMGVANAVSMANLQRAMDKHDFIAILGDQGYDMADFNGTKGDDYMNFVQPIYANLPVLTTTGNHESAYNFSHYKNRFSIVPYQGSGFDNPMQYSIDYKALHLISINTEVLFDGTSEEKQTALNWLEADLTKANQNRRLRSWIVVMGHRPLYCTPQEHTDCSQKAEFLRHGPFIDPQLNTSHFGGLEDLFLKHKVDLYLCGHRHNYERTFPVAKNQRTSTSYAEAPSYFQVISGNSGNYEGPDAMNTSSIADWSAFRYNGYGFTSIQVSKRTLELTHWESKIDGTRGEVKDRILVTKSRKGFQRRE
ncbi:Metallo-dependent phosphatase-like protein [Radiomyces spectabilis]|uniref:Metallo-dependent phosphatase-like protein n=1 Tax=Radiomyces spectabilis TaxID=64574 RepID=UPI00221EF2D1|nr:Metallo-dependent phosphatase-like protein [Radiomyces spectabilis]KAI8387982.1 Metallo-dependent phosphatase-like protein [Radiomyces spectabilis]